MNEIHSQIIAPVFAASRHRMGMDGEGVTTLVCFFECPLRCKYCLNPASFDRNSTRVDVTPEGLYGRLKVDDIYFRATGGGVCFGGGEPGLYADFISEFRKVCGDRWQINVETSLNVPQRNVEVLVPVVDRFFVDIKDMNPEIYRKYTGQDNGRVLANLGLLPPEKTVVRVPHIPKFNTDEDVKRSIARLREMGFTNIDEFEYETKKTQVHRAVRKKLEPRPRINYGKAVCEVLKKIRKTVADENGIELVQEPCPHDFCEKGFCPACDGEAEKLRRHLAEMEAEGKTVNI